MKELQNNMKEYQMKYRKEEADNNLLKSAITELYDTIEKKDLEISDIKNEKQRIESDNAKILQKICELNELLETTNKNTSKKTYQRSSAELKQLTMNTKYNKQIIKDRRPLQMINDNIDSTLDLLPKKRSLSQLNTCDNKNKSMIINRQSVNNPIIIEDDKENENEPASFNKKTKTINTKIEKSSTTPSNINIPPSVTNSRHHHDRSNMKGSTCISCANFYGNETLSVQLNNEEIHLTGQDRVQLHSRHRRQRATTPPGFWSVGFASPPEKE
ncbi:uncharacterized protein BX663DRAFT_503122 [Cokeromyces recurvatus]|uniref:uncharacterized protein n=1 Tax=Cokeromyces recurvatus TaxID=90255 RepID=UPI00221EF1F8|nr:uncharacterized protein BX663DRAFT_503122 [Cokeromyces recurvatus]KAI7904664.1 hypothetical protein BX663DRAFT_503122 [Cokeromyces recurvatus]